METRPITDYENFVSSGIFTLKVGSSLRRIEIHKALLGGISKELEKHVYNDMIEGATDEMTLADEHEDTVTHFVQWAYTGDYPDPPPPDPNALTTDLGSLLSLVNVEKGDSRFQSFMVHATLCVFADRFNIQDLKQKAFDKLTARIVAIGIPTTREDKLAVLRLLDYAFKNLPKCTPQDRLLAYLGLYASCSLESLRTEPEFFELLENDVDFMKELFVHVRRGYKTPWGKTEGVGKLIQRCKSCGTDYTAQILREACRHCRCTRETLFDGDPILLL